MTKIEGVDGRNAARILLFITQLRRKQVTGSFNVAKQTAELLRLVISTSKWTNAEDILIVLRRIGKMMQEAAPTELAIGNIVRRVLFIVRDEYFEARKDAKEEASEVPPAPIELSLTRSLSSLYNILGSSVEPEDLREPRNIKANVLDAINELIDELTISNKNISDQAIEHIHTNEVIMTYGRSLTVENFLKSAGKKRKFELIVVDSAPLYTGHQTAATLSQFGISTTLITDSAVFAMMARVNKVIIGTHAVLANGGLIGQSGLHVLAQAAAYHSVPVVVCTGLYKLSPLFSYEQDAFNDLNSPAAILEFEEADISGKGNPIAVQNPAYDYIPPELVSLFVTNFGGHNPSYIYRLLTEYYSPEDYNL